MRVIQREIASTELENNTLKAIIAGEKELREERRGEEQTAIAMISEDLYL